MTDIKLNKRKCRQGLDGLNVEYVINLDNLKYFSAPPEQLKNKVDKIIFTQDLEEYMATLTPVTEFDWMLLFPKK